MEKTPLIIVGMHRSGTSLTASLLHSAGVNLGSRLMPARESNPKGHFENLDFYKFHQEILRSQNLDINGWSLKDIVEVDSNFVEKARKLIEENAISDVWGWKDPRNTLFLDFWANLLPEAKFLLIYRSPWEVVDSLYRRGDKIFETDPYLAIKSWIYYNQKIIEFANQYSNCYLLTNINTIINNFHFYIDKINQCFSLKLKYPDDNIYEPKLLNNNISKSYISFIELYFPEAIEIYQELECRALTFEKEQDFTWQQSVEISAHGFAIFQNWHSLRKSQIYNRFLAQELKESQEEVKELKTHDISLQKEIEKSNKQLKDTETILQKSQEQLKKTESVLQTIHQQLKHSQTELQNKKQEYENIYNDLEIAKKQLTQTQWDILRYQSQLHSTQEELEKSELEKQELEENSEKLKQELEELQPVLNKLFNQIKKSDNNQNKLQLQVYKMQNIAEKLGTSAKQKESLEIELQQLQNQVNTQEVTLAQLINKLEEKEIYEEKLKLQLHHLETELESQILLKK